MKLLQMTDLHLRPPGRLAYGVVDSNEMVRRACDRIAELDTGIDAILMTGDLADCGLAGEYEQLRLCVDRLAPTPVYLSPATMTAGTPCWRLFWACPHPAASSSMPWRTFPSA